jgi:acyl-coenzyme A thioesterase PaaI-like protein
MPTTDPGYFQAVPWCAVLLSDPDYAVVPSRFGRPMKDGRGEFFTKTLATENTITACVYQTRRPSRVEGRRESSTETTASPPPPVSEVRAFLFTGPGLNGHPGVAHGGFVAAIIDEVMGFLINSNRTATETAGIPPDVSAKSSHAPQQPVPMTVPGISIMTAELTTKYRRPVPTGEALLVRSWIEKIEGRKIFVRATVEGEDRQVLTEGVGLFIALKPGAKPPAVKKSNAKI